MSDDRQLQPGSTPDTALSVEQERQRVEELERLVEEQRADMLGDSLDDEREDVALLNISQAYEKESLRMYKAGRRKRMTAEDI